MASDRKSRRNTKWSPEDELRLVELATAGASLGAIASEMNRSYQSIEKRIRKIKGRPAESRPTGNRAAVMDFSCPSPSLDEPTMDLGCDLISETAMPLVNILYDQLTAYRAVTFAKSNKYKKLKPRFEKVIAAIVRELLIAPSHKGAFAWVQVSMRRIRSSQIGINADLFHNLMDGLCENGFLERLSGYSNAQFSAAARRGRTTRLRATTKLITLCKQHNVAADNVMRCFSKKLATNDA
jgi:hypothetical protein